MAKNKDKKWIGTHFNDNYYYEIIEISDIL